MKTKLVKILGMKLREFKYKSCTAHIAEFPAAATVYDIKSEVQCQGHATELLLAIQKHYQAKGIELGGSIALNDKMARLYTKLGIKEYK